MRISQRSIEVVRETANIVEVASEFTALRRQGARFAGLCPYPDHSEKTPSFGVTPDRGFYYCFGCQRGGDAIKLVMDLKSLSFSEAVSYIAERSGVELEFEGSPADAQAARERNKRRRMVHKALAAATAYYHKYLLRSGSTEARQARKYLENRGLNDSTIEEFRLGFAPPRGSSGFVGAARKLGIERQALDAAGLLSPRGGERFLGRITFPISDRRGRIVGFGARAMGDDHPKYLNSPETEIFTKRDLLYGFPQAAEAIRKQQSVLVVEGYTDVLMLYQAGIKNAVATLGTATTPAHLRSLSGYADKIHVLFDPDDAGEKAIERASAAAAELKLDLRVLRLPEDPADWLLENSAEDFSKLLANSIPALEYVFRRKTERARGAEAAERSRIVSEIKDLITEIEDPVFHGDAVRLASEALGVNPETLQQRRSPAASRSTRGPAPADPLQRAGHELLALLLSRPDLGEEPMKNGVGGPSLSEPFMLADEDFANEDQTRIFSLLKEHAGQDLDSLIADERARPMMDQIGALSSAGEKLYPSEAAIREAWLRVGILSHERAKRQTPDYDEKDRIQVETLRLKDALRAVATES
ncbi:MAG: DNA primase [Rubrobacter sp.]|nr:DNA primase [Rubrobacter sp.]